MTTLAGTLPEVQTAYNQLAAYAATQGITIGVADFGGVRTVADTTRILGYREQDYRHDLASGAIRPDTTIDHYRPIAPFGSSFHNYGAAFDVAIVARPANLSEYSARKLLGAFAPAIGLRWGGNFHPNPDTPHFELAVPLSEAKARYSAMVAGQSSGDGLDGLSGGDIAGGDTNAFDVFDPTDLSPDDLSAISADDASSGALDGTTAGDGAGLGGQGDTVLYAALGVALWALWYVVKQRVG